MIPRNLGDARSTPVLRDVGVETSDNIPHNITAWCKLHTHTGCHKPTELRLPANIRFEDKKLTVNLNATQHNS